MYIHVRVGNGVVVWYLGVCVSSFIYFLFLILSFVRCGALCKWLFVYKLYTYIEKWWLAIEEKVSKYLIAFLHRGRERERERGREGGRERVWVWVCECVCVCVWGCEGVCVYVWGVTHTELNGSAHHVDQQNCRLPLALGEKRWPHPSVYITMATRKEGRKVPVNINNNISIMYL